MEDLEYMKRKIAMAIIAIIISAGLMACGSNSVDSADQTEPVTQESSEIENTDREDVPPVEMSAESTPEPEMEEEEIIEEEEDFPYWYMDSEGIKNETLGVIIKKDIAMTDNFTLDAQIEMKHDTDLYGARYVSTHDHFSCGYYEGDLGAYISEHSNSYPFSQFDEIKKGKIGKLDYAYGESGSFMFVFVVDNGIVFSSELQSEYGSAEEQMSGILESENESNTDKLAYISDDGFHIPALGILIPYASGQKGEDDSISVSGQGGKGVPLDIREDKDAQSNVDFLLQDLVSYGNTAIEETVEINIGKYQFSGRGVAKSGNDEMWYFVSNDWEGYIFLYVYANSQYSQYNGGDCKEYISIIENLE